jgi:spore germination cell wall hydrolase CwlJ-like protein
MLEQVGMKLAIFLLCVLGMSYLGVAITAPEQLEVPFKATGARIIVDEPKVVPTILYEDQGIGTDRDRQCLAINTYYEARNQSKAGRLATMQVVVNRVHDHRFPNTICDVVTQGPTYTNWLGNEWPVRDQCQFSWYCDGMSDIPVEAETFFEMEKLVDEFLSNNMIDFTDGALYYHADYVSPEWRNDYIVTAVIDNHIFYRP